MKASIKVSRQNANRIFAKGVETAFRIAAARRAMAEAEQSQQELNDLLATLAGASKRDIPEGHSIRFDPGTESIVIEPAKNNGSDGGEGDAGNVPSINGNAGAISSSAGVNPSINH